MASKDINDYVFRKLQGQTLIKVPGSIAGNGFILDRLTDCEVYILDHTSQVQVDDCGESHTQQPAARTAYS
ncbi:C-CAP/cofactor C-like domain-containing protein [Haematococcus lacustris]|uniref:C-CAP/cofactor C-like domain-containing protein n=1 Tax=Haematococcus lacustris TaxID=44745 RepID=A0A6A0A448_HAELA|nr:C-CAP/cofactor C-like domain-containing protein [Haematococcus lacustris]